MFLIFDGSSVSTYVFNRMTKHMNKIITIYLHKVIKSIIKFLLYKIYLVLLIRYSVPYWLKNKKKFKIELGYHLFVKQLKEYTCSETLQFQTEHHHYFRHNFWLSHT